MSVSTDNIYHLEMVFFASPPVNICVPTAGCAPSGSMANYSVRVPGAEIVPGTVDIHRQDHNDLHIGLLVAIASMVACIAGIKAAIVSTCKLPGYHLASLWRMNESFNGSNCLYAGSFLFCLLICTCII